MLSLIHIFKLTEGKSTVTIAAGDPSKIVDDTQAAEGADTAASGDVTVEDVYKRQDHTTSRRS